MSRPFLIFMIHVMFWPSLAGADMNKNGRAESEKPIHVALLIDKLDAFWNQFVRIMNVAAEQLGVKVSIHHGHESHLAMIQKAQTLVQGPDKPDVVMFKSFKGNGYQIMHIAAQQHVKTFSVNAPISLTSDSRTESSYLVGELLPDDEKAGYELVKALREEMRSKKISHVHLIAINGDQADSPAKLREKGLRRAAGAFKDVSLHQVTFDAWTAPHAADQFELLKKRYPMANAVWGGNDAIALIIAERAKALGYALGENLFIGGIDISPEGLAAVKKGDLVTSVGGHIMDGAWSLVVLYDYFKLGKLESRQFITPMVAVTRSNVDHYKRILDPQKTFPVDFTRHSRWLHPKSAYDFSFPID